MEISRLPQIKNKNFLESQIRRFTTVKNIIDNIEEENFNKFNQIELIKKTNLLEQKKQNYSINNSHLFSVKHYLSKDNKKVIKKIENQLIKKKLRLEKSPKLICSYENIIKDDLFSPLNDKYKLLISNIDYNKRCFRNLSNKEFDNIFNDKFKWGPGLLDNNNSIPRSDVKKYKISKNKKNKEIKKNYKSRNNKKNGRLSTISCDHNYNNIFSNRIKNIKHSNKNSIDDSTKLAKYNLCSTISINNYKSFRMKSKCKYFNDYNSQFNTDKKYRKFVLLLKKQNDKNIKLLNDVKKQETMNKDNLLISIVKMKGYKTKKYPYY